MTIPKLRHASFVLVTLAAGLAGLGCDTESTDPPTVAVDDDAAADDAATDDDSDADDDGDGDGDGGDDGAGSRPTALAAPGVPSAGHHPSPPLHPCGNGVIDGDEACDDGLGNGNDRECTQGCTFNDCELDPHGVCIDDGPAADVPLYPCARSGDRRVGCTLGFAAL